MEYLLFQGENMKIRAEILLDLGCDLLLTRFIPFDSILLQFRYEKNCLSLRWCETIDIVSIGEEGVSVCTKCKKLGENMRQEGLE